MGAMEERLGGVDVFGDVVKEKICKSEQVAVPYCQVYVIVPMQSQDLVQE